MSVLTTTVFEQNLLAYTSGSTLIVNQGGTRSSKSYSIMQLLLEIAIRSKKPLIISVCSYALPHLKLGVMRDFDEILLARGFIPDAIKNKTDNFYKIGRTTIEFFGTDNLGKVHGPARDILFINEGNFIKPEVYTQLAIRTKQAIFIDFNPTREFWYHSEIQGKVAHELIKSTYKHNQFLTLAQIERIEAKKSNVEWWRVYGEGELGRLEDAIFTNWQYGEFDKTLPYIFALDFGSRDPDAMIKIAVDSKLMRIYVDEMLYQSGNSTADLYKLITDCGVKKELIVADSAGTRTITDLDALGLNIEPCVKNKILDDIKAIKDYQIIVTENSYNVVRELNTWVWLNKKGEVPLDDNNHTIDPVRYGFNRLTKKQFIRKMRVL